MKLFISVITLILAIGFGIFLVTAIMQSEVTIDTETAKGVYNLKTNEFNGTVSGWSSGGGFGSAFAEVKKTAESQHTTKITIGAGGAAVFLIIGLATLGSGLKASKRRAQQQAQQAAQPQQWGNP